MTPDGRARSEAGSNEPCIHPNEATAAQMGITEWHKAGSGEKRIRELATMIAGFYSSVEVETRELAKWLRIFISIEIKIHEAAQMGIME